MHSLIYFQDGGLFHSPLASGLESAAEKNLEAEKKSLMESFPPECRFFFIICFSILASPDALCGYVKYPLTSFDHSDHLSWIGKHTKQVSFSPTIMNSWQILYVDLDFGSADWRSYHYEVVSFPTHPHCSEIKGNHAHPFENIRGISKEQHRP